MSVVRTLVATAVTTLALVAVAKPAAAFQPIKGNSTVGPAYSKSVSSGDFGASFQIFARGYANDYQQLCTTTAPTYQCSNMAGFTKQICTIVMKPMNDFMCAKSRYGVPYGYGAEGKAEADITLFGDDFELFDIGASAKAEPDLANAEWHMRVAGVKLAGNSSSSGLSKSWTLGERTLLSASSTFMLGPIPITVEAAAVGRMGIDANVSFGTASASATATPWVGIDGEFSAGLGTKGLSAGIEGDLVLVELSTPGTASMTWKGGKNFGYAASLDLEIHSLDGSISLYGEAGPYKKSWEIFSWEGLTYTKNLGQTSGTLSL